MTSWIDSGRWDRERGKQLRKVLAGSYPSRAEIVALVDDVGIDRANLPSDSARIGIQWHDLLHTTLRNGQLPALLDAVVSEKRSLADKIGELRSPAPMMPEPVPDDPAAHDFNAPSWKNFSADGRAEAVIIADQPTFVEISFLSLGMARARSICRLRTRFPAKGSGTAFRVADRHLLTNYHVLFDNENDDRKITSAQAWFNYETDEHGNLRPVTRIDCDPDSIVGEKDEDWALIQTTDPIPQDFPILPLNGADAPTVDDRVYIIQHPLGQTKKIAFQHNLVRYVDQAKIQYWTDTDLGSSGSPVFNEDWQVVALHHFSVETPHDPKAGHRNQGRRIDRVAGRMKELGVYPGGDG